MLKPASHDHPLGHRDQGGHQIKRRVRIATDNARVGWLLMLILVVAFLVSTDEPSTLPFNLLANLARVELFTAAPCDPSQPLCRSTVRAFPPTRAQKLPPMVWAGNAANLTRSKQTLDLANRFRPHATRFYEHYAIAVFGLGDRESAALLLDKAETIGWPLSFWSSRRFRVRSFAGLP